MYEFTKDCMVINESIELINKTDDVMPLCNNLLKSLKDYSLNHFAHEEAYMEEINDPELSLQKKEHAAFAEKINNFKLDTSSKENAKKSLNELLTYLVRWLYHHILSSDMMIGKMSASANEVKDSSIFDFSEKYMTGIELVDDEHRHLFEIIKETNDVINAAYLHDKYDEIMRLLSELKDYTESHFHDEEELMLRINYPHINSQKHAHSAFIEKLVNINLSELDNIDDNQDEYLNELITFLLQWLSNHILGSDKKIGEYIKSHPELKSKI